jgi:hypothetical protein
MAAWPHVPTQWECVAEAVLHFLADSSRERKGPGAKYPQVPTSSDLLPPARSHLLQFPEPPKIAPPAGNQSFHT